MNKIMGAQYNRILRAMATRNARNRDASATQADKDRAQQHLTELLAAWPNQLRVRISHPLRILSACGSRATC